MFWKHKTHWNWAIIHLRFQWLKTSPKNKPEFSQASSALSQTCLNFPWLLFVWGLDVYELSKQAFPGHDTVFCYAYYLPNTIIAFRISRASSSEGLWAMFFLIPCSFLAALEFGTSLQSFHCHFIQTRSPEIARRCHTIISVWLYLDLCMPLNI